MFKKIKATLLIANASTIIFFSSAYALDGVSVERGEWSHSSFTNLAAQESWSFDNDFLIRHDLTTYWEFNAGEIRGNKSHDINGEVQTVTDVGITPVLRRHGEGDTRFFSEIGIGANYMSAIFNNDSRVMGTRFQFGDFVGVGYKFETGIEMTVRFQHFSNAGIREPNPAFNYGIVKLAYAF